MPPRGRKPYKKKLSNSSQKQEENVDEKENICTEAVEKSFEKVSEKAKPENIKKSVLSPSKQETKKTVGFWSKKLQDLKKDDSDKEKCSLYEFNETEESRSFQKKKKPKQRAKVSKRKKAAVCKYNKPVKLINKIPESQKKSKQCHRQSLFREQIMLCKEREKLADKGKKFTFSTAIQSLGVTSTPAVNRDNLIGASNFLFLSPITSINEEPECYSNIQSTPVKSKAVVESQNILPPKQKIQKTETEQQQNVITRRVLRNGKVLNT